MNNSGFRSFWEERIYLRSRCFPLQRQNIFPLSPIILLPNRNINIFLLTLLLWFMEILLGVKITHLFHGVISFTSMEHKLCFFRFGNLGSHAFSQSSFIHEPSIFPIFVLFPFFRSSYLYCIEFSIFLICPNLPGNPPSVAKIFPLTKLFYPLTP